MLKPVIVEVELVEGGLVGVRLSNDMVVLLSADQILSLNPPIYVLLVDDIAEAGMQ